MDATSTARAYYDYIDTDQYELLGSLIAPSFVQERPDRTFTGRAQFVEFMQEERPVKDTSHDIFSVFSAPAGDVAVEGALRRADGSAMFRFVDVFRFDESGRIGEIATYTA